MGDYKAVPEFKKRLSDASMATLLGLTGKEYAALKHLPLKMTQDTNGLIVDFYMQISTDNDGEVMTRLSMDKKNCVHFEPGTVYELYD